MQKINATLLFIAFAIAGSSCSFTKGKKVQATDSKSMKSIHSYNIKTLDGSSDINLSSFKGKKIMIVNTASKCGFTSQYKQLQEMAETYKDKLVIIGCPCNQFGGQEPGNSAEIAGFCEKNYGVTFPLTEKLNVKGSDQHPLYQWLTSKNSNGALDSEVSWNFCKYIMDEEGQLLGFFPSMVKPNDSQITSLL